jgi:isoquinoline 1-oxidoreductase beta subunit
VRKGGAMARVMLVQAAADAWKVSPAECVAANSVITHTPSGRTTTFGKVAGAAGKLSPPTEVTLKDPKTWKLAGQPVKRLDTSPKLDGSQVFGMDVKLPGMLNAAIKDCPVFGGKIRSFNAAAIAGRPGVKKVVPVGESAVAVIADTWWHAKTALEALPIEWDEGPNAKVSSASIAAFLKEGLDAPQAIVGNESGDARKAIAESPRKLEAVYSYPHQNHATMEVMNATVRWTPERCEVWCPTQNGEAALAAAAEAAGLPPSKCDVYKLNLGGGFGRRGAHDWVTQAVTIARQMPGTPVKMLWSREEDMAHGKYHPITQCRMTAGLDAQGNVTGLHMRISGQSIVAGLLPQNLVNGRDPVVFQGLNPSGAEGVFSYKVPALLIDHAMRNPHVPPGFWRGVNINQNAVFIESFMDELAEAAGQDPVEFRRKLLGNSPRALGVLNAVATQIGWSKPAPQGVYRGVAQMKAFDSFVAAACEISVKDGNKVKVHRIVAATDPGYAVNPAQIERQIAGSFVYGLSALFFQECTVKDGRIEQTNFHQYNSMRIAQMPKVESIIMPTGGTVWGGIGEPTICVAAPAVLNAYAKATGKRIRSVPLKNHGIQLV